jgi:aminomuconate-semialdehyde/2-hydroxymuconate-6-semialdehyde dehydrogenase
MKTQIINYINGELVPAKSGATIDNFDPSTGKVYSQLPASGKEDVEAAVEAATKAFLHWSSMSIDKRSGILHNIANGIEAQLDELALAESVDNGKPKELARRIDIPRAASNFRFFASAIVGASSSAHIMEGEAVNYTRRKPVGVVGCISPWNLPLYLFTWKIAPALAAGNCVISKPSELTPMTAYLLSQICIDNGLPPGVLNILHGLGSEVGQAIVEHPRIKAISFTGGTNTGHRLAATAAPMFKKLSLELGGKNPTIIFDDCDFKEMLETTVKSSFTNQGEICLCGSRILVQASIYERFCSEFTDRVQQLTLGDPLTDVSLGALVSAGHLEKIKHYVKLAIEEGGEILTGGTSVNVEGRCKDGYFYSPTVIKGLSNQCRVNQEEIFGPVVSIIPFQSDEDAISIANDTQYGLSATIWTSNVKRAHNTAHQLDAGVIWINCWLLRDLRTPFGGMKASGVGREGGEEALRFFTEAQNICIQL